MLMHLSLMPAPCFQQTIIVLPVLNVPREDLHLRREIVFWFEQVLQFDLKVLICRDEIDYDQLNASSGYNLSCFVVCLIQNLTIAILLLSRYCIITC